MTVKNLLQELIGDFAWLSTFQVRQTLMGHQKNRVGNPLELHIALVESLSERYYG